MATTDDEDAVVITGTIDEYIAARSREDPEFQALIAFYGAQLDREIAAWHQHRADRKRITAAKQRARIVTRAKGHRRPRKRGG